MELDVLPLKPLLAAALGAARAACGGEPRPSATAPPAPAPTPAPAPAPPVADAGAADAAAAPAKDAAAEAAPEPEPPEPEPLPLPEGTTVLHLGDSFAGALGPALNKELRAAGLRSVLRYKTASFIPGWASGYDVPVAVAQTKPDLVLITLGANEVEMTDPSIRAGAIRRLVEKVGERPCVWISIPLWKEGNGLMDVIRDNCAPCHFLDSSKLITDVPRVSDKIHPTMKARGRWAKIVVDWLKRHRQPTDQHPWALREPTYPEQPISLASPGD